MKTRRQVQSCAAAHSTRRHAIATIELVMSFPVLMFLGVMIFSLGNSHLWRSSTAVRARRQAWDQRDPQQPPSANPVLQISELDKNRHTESVTHQIRTPPLFNRVSETKTAESRNTLMMGPWTDENPNAGLRELRGMRMGPHARTLGQLMQLGNSGWFVTIVEQFQQLLDSGLSLLEAIAPIGDVLNTVLEVAATGLSIIRWVAEGFLLATGGWFFDQFNHSGFLIDAARGNLGSFPGN